MKAELPDNDASLAEDVPRVATPGEQTPRVASTFKWCFCGLLLGVLVLALTQLAIGLEKGDASVVLHGCVFLVILVFGCVVAALLNIAALKLLAKWGNR